MSEWFQREIGGVTLLRPRPQMEELFRGLAERHLRERYISGCYADTAKINEILQCQFGYFHGCLMEKVTLIASVDLLECILTQYDRTAEIDTKHKRGLLGSTDATYWQENGPVIRRSLKYIAEVVSHCRPPISVNLPEATLLVSLEEIIIAAEMMVQLYILSDQTYGLIPDETTFVIHPDGAEDYWELQVAHPARIAGIRERSWNDMQLRDRYLATPQPYEDEPLQARFLDTICSQELGFPYSMALHTLRAIVNKTTAGGEVGDIPFVNRSYLIASLSEDLHLPQSVVERLIDGFTIRVECAMSEGRRLWCPKQEYRPNRRGFFEATHPTGPHLMWSRAMARECLRLLMDGTIYQHFPKEWRTKATNRALGNLQNSAGKWFESEVARNLAVKGAVGKPSVKQKVGRGHDRVLIPEHVGELDYLGYLPQERTLVLLECKTTNFAHEPSLSKGDISRFVERDDSYVKQLDRKRKWLGENYLAVGRALFSDLAEESHIAPVRIATALVTMYPTFASYYIPQFPCVALSELLSSYQERGRWPYQVGVAEL